MITPALRTVAQHDYLETFVRLPLLVWGFFRDVGFVESEAAHRLCVHAQTRQTMQRIDADGQVQYLFGDADTGLWGVVTIQPLGLSRARVTLTQVGEQPEYGQRLVELWATFAGAVELAELRGQAVSAS